MLRVSSSPLGRVLSCTFPRGFLKRLYLTVFTLVGVARGNNHSTGCKRLHLTIFALIHVGKFPRVSHGCIIRAYMQSNK